MNRLAGLLLLLLMPVWGLVAQTRTSSALLKINSSTHRPINVELDGKISQRIAKEIVIGDIPAGRHRIRLFVLEQKPNGKKWLKEVYSGKIHLQKGIEYSGVWNERTKRFSMQRNGYWSGVQSAPATPVPIPSTQPIMEEKHDLWSYLQTAGNDNERMQALEQALFENSYTVEDVSKVLSHFQLESSKVEAIKKAVPKVEDPENARQFLRQITNKQARSELETYLKTLDL
jgi:hypothetical protein